MADPETTKFDRALVTFRWLGGAAFAVPIVAAVAKGIVGLGQDIARSGYLGLGWMGCVGVALWLLPTWFEKDRNTRAAVQWVGLAIVAGVIALALWSPAWIVEKH